MLKRILGVCASLTFLSGTAVSPAAAQTLEAFAKFDADTFAPDRRRGNL